MKALVIAVCLTVGILSGCDNRAKVMDSAGLDQSPGSFKIAVPLPKSAKEGVDRVECVITAPDMATMQAEMSVGSDDMVRGTVDGVKPGSGRTVTLNAYDSAGALTYAGSATVDIVARETVRIDIVLKSLTRHNQVPIANAGPDQSVSVGATVELDGSGSSDADGDALTYQWSAPSGMSLSNVTVARPQFTAGTAGTYRFTLVVNDGKVDSGPDEVVVTVVQPTAQPMEFVWIEPGTFTMGDAELGFTPHQVTISRGFYLGKYELTQGQWEAVMGTQPWSGQAYVQSNSNHPAVYISWNDVQEFIGKLNAAAGEELYRLPTEAEWEYACRAGTTTRWSFGDDESQLGDYAWYYRVAGGSAGEQYAHAVGTKKPNPWGLYDMHGNVYEWCQDWYGDYSSSAQTDPTGPATGSSRVLRGGAFAVDAQLVRSAYHLGGLLDGRFYYVGVRLLRTR